MRKLSYNQPNEQDSICLDVNLHVVKYNCGLFEFDWSLIKMVGKISHYQNQLIIYCLLDFIYWSHLLGHDDSIPTNDKLNFQLTSFFYTTNTGLEASLYNKKNESSFNLFFITLWIIHVRTLYFLLKLFKQIKIYKNQ